jgi:N-acetylmuramic acid 6-phosphate (MurNAc-6-P) etherase
VSDLWGFYSLAICDESPLQSNGLTVTKEKYIGAYIFSAYLIVSRIVKLIFNKINSSGEIHIGKIYENKQR